MTAASVPQRIDALGPREAASVAAERRTFNRVATALPIRLTWKDRSGATRFATGTTRDISELGVFVECRTPLSLSLFRLVELQLEVGDRRLEGLPSGLTHGRALGAVYRVRPPDIHGRPQGVALRLMIEPRRSGHRRTTASEALRMPSGRPLSQVAGQSAPTQVQACGGLVVKHV